MRPLHPRRVSVELGAKRRLKSALSDAKKPKRATKKASAPVRSLDEEIAKRERPGGRRRRRLLGIAAVGGIRRGRGD